MKCHAYPSRYIDIDDILKSFFRGPTGQLQSKFGKHNPWVKGTQLFTNIGSFNFLKGDNIIFSVNQFYSIIKALRRWVCCFELVFR